MSQLKRFAKVIFIFFGIPLLFYGVGKLIIYLRRPIKDVDGHEIKDVTEIFAIGLLTTLVFCLAIGVIYVLLSMFYNYVRYGEVKISIPWNSE